ncbi:MAG: AAA family ATPase [Leptospiraceae bacterium]|nr:AAA family ATPase [Leptospiraceae bacterium]
MHEISYISINNFRACKSIEFPLGGYTPLVGQNNSGKTTILDAIQWVLKPTTLSESDFNDVNKPVQVIIKIEGITSNLLEKIIEKKHKAAIEPYCKDGVLWISVKNTPPSAGKASIIQEIWDIEKYSDNGIPSQWRSYPTGLPQAVNILIPTPLYITAMDDLSEDLGKAKAGTTIKDLLDEIMKPILSTHAELKSAMKTISDILCVDGETRSDILKKFDTEATNYVSEFFPGLSLDINLQMVDIKDFFKAGDLYVTEKYTGDRRRFDNIGSGAQRSIQMALVRYLAEYKSKNPENVSRRLLFIDEPELYLHPQGVRRLREALYKLSNSGFQIIFSTHSPLMLNRENASNTIIINKDNTHGVIRKMPLKQAVQTAFSDAEAQSRTIFELGNLAEIYFSKTVIICEGKTDYRILPLIYEKIYDHSPDLEQICFVPVGSCSSIAKAQKVLEAMEINAIGIADLDFAFTHARVQKIISNDEDMKRTQERLKFLQKENKFFLDLVTGLPNNKGDIDAEAAWGLFANDGEGKKIVTKVHNELKEKKIWVWKEGSIEQVINSSNEKGEKGIIENENIIVQMKKNEIIKSMKPVKDFFDWLLSEKD